MLKGGNKNIISNKPDDVAQMIGLYLVISDYLVLDLGVWSANTFDKMVTTRANNFTRQKALLPRLFGVYKLYWRTNEPRCEKTGIRGFRPGPTQTRLHDYTIWLEA